MDSANVTAIVPVHNGAKTLSRALNSILSQTLPIAKVIVVDDFSSDSTPAVISDFKQRFKEVNLDFVAIRTSKQLGPGLARNLGMQNSSTRYIAFLDADDAWSDYKIELQYAFMVQNPEYFFTCHASLFQNKDVVQKDFELTYKSLLFRNRVATRTVMIRSTHDYRFRQGLSEDYDLWLQILSAGLRGRFLSGPKAFHFKPEFSKDGVSGNLWKHEVFELKTISRTFRYKKEFFLFSSLAFAFSLIKFVRRSFIRLARMR